MFFYSSIWILTCCLGMSVTTPPSSTQSWSILIHRSNRGCRRLSEPLSLHVEDVMIEPYIFRLRVFSNWRGEAHDYTGQFLSQGIIPGSDVFDVS